MMSSIIHPPHLSPQVMASMNSLVKLPALQKVMVDMSREMEKAGLIEEMTDDMFEMDDEEEEEAQEAIDQVSRGREKRRERGREGESLGGRGREGGGAKGAKGAGL